MPRQDTRFRIKKLLKLCTISVELNGCGYAARIGIHGTVMGKVRKPI